MDVGGSDVEMIAVEDSDQEMLSATEGDLVRVHLKDLQFLFIRYFQAIEEITMPTPTEAPPILDPAREKVEELLRELREGRKLQMILRQLNLTSSWTN